MGQDDEHYVRVGDVAFNPLEPVGSRADLLADLHVEAFRPRLEDLANPLGRALMACNFVTDEHRYTLVCHFYLPRFDIMARILRNCALKLNGVQYSAKWFRTPPSAGTSVHATTVFSP